jgi:hypothetical protein
MDALLDLEVDARDRHHDDDAKLSLIFVFISIILFYLSFETGLLIVPVNKAIPESL